MTKNKKLFLAKYGSVEHLDKLINDKNIEVRWNLARHPSLQKEHLDKLVNDKDSSVREAAKEQLKKRFPG